MNSNTSDTVTRQVSEVVAGLLPDVEVAGMSAAYGPAGIGGRADLTISSLATLEVIAAHAHDFDAVIVACFSDPGLAAARELLDIPVIGIGEASFLTAAMLGARFSVVTVTPRVVPIVHEMVRMVGLEARFAGVTIMSSEVLGAANPLPWLQAGVEEAVREQGAEVAVLGGAAFAGQAGPLSQRVDVPVVGSVEAAAVQALALMRLRPGRATTGSYARPAPKRMHGLHPALMQHMALEVNV
ncbi:MAG: aspartate/glutamate racemase family protein [Moraxellaceae bacterium]|nr:aspartate/glutamate racemase family protein [Moraxellaceae bacterium]